MSYYVILVCFTYLLVGSTKIWYIYFVQLAGAQKKLFTECMQSFLKKGNTKVGKNLRQPCGVLPSGTCAQPYYPCSVAGVDTCVSVIIPQQHVIAINA